MAFLYEATKMQQGKKALQDKRQVLNIKRMKSDIFNQSQVLPWQAFHSTQPKLLENFMPQKHSSKACFPNLRRARPFTHHCLFGVVSKEIVYFQVRREIFVKCVIPLQKIKGVYRYTYTTKEYMPVGLHTQVNICMTEITLLNKVNYILYKTTSSHVCTAR